MMPLLLIMPACRHAAAAVCYVYAMPLIAVDVSIRCC